MDTLVDISSLTIRFPEQDVPAVAGISFSIRRGEILALVGESGSGKSLTALSLTSLLPKQAIVSGEVTASLPNKTELHKISTKELSSIRGGEIAMIFQEPMTSLNPVLTVGTQVKESVELHTAAKGRLAREKVMELFTTVELTDPASMLHRYPHQLSGGQRQRVMIAMAMAGNPQLLIADEPTTALDARVQKNILDLLKKLQQQTGLSILLISHDMGLVAAMADRVMVMHKGAIVESGAVKQILENPQHAYTKGLLACRVSPEKKGYRLPTLADPFSAPAALAPLPARENIVLKVEDLTVAFPKQHGLFQKKPSPLVAVDAVSFNVHEHEFVGLAGESGSGKSTLGRAVLHLVKPTSGKVVMNGQDLSELNEESLRKSRRNFQVVFQDPYGSLHPGITAGEALIEPLLYHQLVGGKKEAREKAVHLLESVHLSPDHINRYPHQFSGGQRQRLSIARALSLEPRFLVFDESVSALDVSVQATILNLISDLRQKYGFSALFISHDLAVVHYLCDRIMIMQNGKIVEEGTADKIFHAPGNVYTKELLASML